MVRMHFVQDLTQDINNNILGLSPETRLSILIQMFSTQIDSSTLKCPLLPPLDMDEGIYILLFFA